MDEFEAHLRESFLEVQVNAAVTGHDLSGFEPVNARMAGGYEARCRICSQTAWVGKNGLINSLLEDECAGATQIGGISDDESNK